MAKGDQALFYHSNEGLEIVGIAKIVKTAYKHAATTDDLVRERTEELSPEFTRNGEGVTVGVGGFAEIYREMQHNIESDLIKAETIAFPLIPVRVDMDLAGGRVDTKMLEEISEHLGTQLARGLEAGRPSLCQRRLSGILRRA